MFPLFRCSLIRSHNFLFVQGVQLSVIGLIQVKTEDGRIYLFRVGRNRKLLFEGGLKQLFEDQVHSPHISSDRVDKCLTQSWVTPQIVSITTMTHIECSQNLIEHAKTCSIQFKTLMD